MSKVDLTDIVFALKNKEYGAFVLRKLYGKFVTIALIITAVFFSTAISTPMILNAIEKKHAKREPNGDNGCQSSTPEPEETEGKRETGNCL
ncbi:MAG: hypothetical protein IPJ75_05525 [Ignavibacteriales bacterium]|nr:hypothetical protein [Ignavibacteriales bacterium]